jgi:hypothetical protein
VLAQDHLDFPQLNAKSTDLNLMIDATEKLDISIGQPSTQITGSIKPILYSFGKRIDNETLAGQRIIVEVTPAQVKAL